MSSLSTRFEDWLTEDEIAYLRNHVVKRPLSRIVDPLRISVVQVMTDAQLTQLRAQIMSLTEINSRLKIFRKSTHVTLCHTFRPVTSRAVVAEEIANAQ